jgi:hypothetical protein
MQNVTSVRSSRRFVRARRACLTLTACVAALSIGCDSKQTQYRLSLRLEEGALVRTLARVPEKKSDGSTSVGFEGAQAEELTRMYGPAADDGSFSARFPGRLPGDLGGSGALDRHTGALGNVYTYRERLQGEDAPLDFPMRVQRAVTSALALTEGWTASDCVDNPEAAAAFAAWVRERFIPDTGNLALLQWLETSGLLSERELELRSVQLLDERGYTQARSPFDDFEDLWEQSFQRVLQVRGSETDPGPQAPRDPSSDDDLLFASLGRHIARSEDFQVWNRTRTPAPGEEPVSEGAIDALLRKEQSPQAEDALGHVGRYVAERHPELQDLLGDFFVPDRPDGRVLVTLALPAPPIDTNGTWRAEAGRIEWNEVPMRRKPQLSALLYATWAEPSATYQAERFGRTLLDGARLADYERWREALDAEPRRAWDGLVDALRPGDDLRARIEALRLPGSAPGDGMPRGADLLLEALDAGAKTP